MVLASPWQIRAWFMPDCWKPLGLGFFSTGWGHTPSPGVTSSYGHPDRCTGSILTPQPGLNWGPLVDGGGFMILGDSHSGNQKRRYGRPWGDVVIIPGALEDKRCAMGFLDWSVQGAMRRRRSRGRGGCRLMARHLLAEGAKHARRGFKPGDAFLPGAMMQVNSSIFTAALLTAKCRAIGFAALGAMTHHGLVQLPANFYAANGTVQTASG